ncbi:sterile alpha motif domain-containing 3-like isoform X2 [Labeo rohita]|uniref:Sterile alpha motif domain-containing 3-like isoform X2 n=1 Tax=Labeo rohita TaxID=84645 RepID=A0A498MSE1_LABRO|nr:sterile alpha motif domain-containing 3-like isoform X2 [Labeo rohita]
MGNYRSKMRSLGHTDVTVNAGKRGRYSTSSDPPNKNIKKPRKGEVNYLPNLPSGHDASSLELLRQQLADEMKKKNPDAVFINQKMDMTLSLRRQEVVINKPPVGQILQRWPALFRESQVYQEFNQIVGKNLKQEFYGSLDRHCPQLIQIFRPLTSLTCDVLPFEGFQYFLVMTQPSSSEHVLFFHFASSTVDSSSVVISSMRVFCSAMVPFYTSLLPWSSPLSAPAWKSPSLLVLHGGLQLYYGLFL